MRVSVIVPFYNEKDGLPRLVQKLADLKRHLETKHTLELVLVDDGSSDHSRHVLDECLPDEPHVIKVTHERNRGLGAALRTGFQRATGDVVCCIDSDCTYEPSEIPRLLETLQREGADIATGSPYHPQGRVENVTLWRLWMSQAASWMYRRLTPRGLYTYTCMVRAYRRQVVESLVIESDGFVAVTEILLRALQSGSKVVEVPMVLHSRVTGVSKMKTLRTIRAHLKLMARTLSWRFSGSPLPETRAVADRILNP